MTLEELEKKVRILEDIEAIKKLKFIFAYLIDARDWPGLVNLFTDDGVVDINSEHHKGKLELTTLFSTLPYSFTHHRYINPVIEVEEEKATGKWYFELPATHTEKSPRALWLAGKHEDEYVKVGGEWKIKATRAKLFYNTPYDEGWVKTRMFE